jgi:hypothetical protein
LYRRISYNKKAGGWIMSELTAQQIINSIKDKNIQLQGKEIELVTFVENMAEAQRDYKIKRATLTLQMKADKYPATLIPDLVKGDKDVADLKMKFVVAEGIYKACKESIYNLRAGLDSARSVLAYKKQEYEIEHKKSEHTT